MNKTIIKRNIGSVLSYMILEILFLKSVLRINYYDIEFIQAVNIFGAVTVGFLIIKFIVFPYITTDGVSISINHNFKKDVFAIKEIMSVRIEQGEFELKDGKKIKYNSFMLSTKNSELLKNWVNTNLDEAKSTEE